MIKKCAICGKEDEDFNMYSRFTGRTNWFCAECYNNGDRQAVSRTVERHEKYRKRDNEKK